MTTDPSADDVTTLAATETVAVGTPPASMLGPWRIGTALGRGGQGSTFRATHVATGQVAAVKRFRVADMADWKRFELFEREAATLAALEHPAIPRLFRSGASADGGERWIAMELIEGEALSQRMGVPLAPEVLARLFAEALEVLAYLHGRVPPVVHRDIKPHNLIVRGDGRLVLVDFGSVRTALAPDGSSTVVGTFGYLAPEQLHGAASPASDLYSLGVTMIALASGIEGTSLPRRGLRIDAERVLEHYPDARLRRVWSALVEPDPDLRPRDVAAVRALMQPPLELPPEPAAAAALPPLFPHWTPRGPLGRLLMFLVLLVLGIGAGVMGLVMGTLLPRVQSRQAARISRDYKRDPVRQSVALAQLSHHHEVQRSKLRRAKDQVDAWQVRLRQQNTLLSRSERQRLPRGRGQP